MKVHCQPQRPDWLFPNSAASSQRKNHHPKTYNPNSDNMNDRKPVPKIVITDESYAYVGYCRAGKCNGQLYAPKRNDICQGGKSI